jgi:hypothetical protein
VYGATEAAPRGAARAAAERPRTGPPSEPRGPRITARPKSRRAARPAVATTRERSRAECAVPARLSTLPDPSKVPGDGATEVDDRGAQPARAEEERRALEARSCRAQVDTTGKPVAEEEGTERGNPKTPEGNTGPRFKKEGGAPNARGHTGPGGPTGNRKGGGPGGADRTGRSGATAHRREGEAADEGRPSSLIRRGRVVPDAWPREGPTWASGLRSPFRVLAFRLRV